MKKAWLMTHDTYVDRRIFFFADVLKNRGYEVKLFADEYYDILCKDDPGYVVRPEISSTVRKYIIPIEDVSEYHRDIVSHIVASQNRYYKKRRRLTTKIVGLPENVKIYLTQDDYVISFTTDSGFLCYVGNADTYMMLNNSQFSSELGVCEKAIKSYIAGIPTNEIEKKYEIQIWGKNKEKSIYLHPYYSRLMYTYDCDLAVLKEYRPMNKVQGDLDDSNVKFRDFQDEIYDYDRIFSRIKMELLTEVPDLVYVADLTTLPIAIQLKEKYGCKIIMDCHEWWYKQTVLWEPERKKKQTLSEKYEKELYPKCDLRITVGKYLALRMGESIGCDFEVIYSCINSELGNLEGIDDISLKRKYGLKESDKVAIFQGGMSTHRNLENLARATKYFSDDCYLLLLTTGTFESTFRNVLKKEGNPDRVIWGGWIPQKDLLKYTSQADLGIIPYVAENDYAECFVPNKLMEYFTVQMPILFDNSLQELRMVAGGNGVGFGTDLRDPQLFGRTIDELLHDEDRLKGYRNNYSNCGSKFDFESQKVLFEQMLDRYDI